MKISKSRKIYIGFSFFLIIIMLSSINTVNILGVDNYSEYLYDEPISIQNDKAHLFQHASDGSNGYRNQFETNFLFPQKLYSNLFSTSYSTNYGKYYVIQSHLNNLDNDYAFKNYELESNYEKESVFNESEFDFSKGYYNGIYNITAINGILPNQDITKEWSEYPTANGIHYEHIDEYPNPNDNDYLYTGGYGYKICIFNFSTVDSLYIYNQVQVSIRVKTTTLDLVKINVSCSDISNFSNIQQITLTTAWITHNLTFDLLMTNPNNFQVKIQKNEYIGYEHSISQLYTTFQILEPNNSLSEIDNTYAKYLSEYNENSGSGHYLGQYSFNNDAVGSNPAGWSTTEPSGTNVQVLTEYTTHKKVVDIDDNSGTNTAELYQSLSDKSNGGIEFWYICSVMDDNYLILYHGATVVIRLLVDTNLLYVYYSGSFKSVCAITTNQWYHIRLTFECGTNLYDGLSVDTCNIYVNSVKYGAYAFQNPDVHIDLIKFLTATTVQPELKADAIDYSWSTDYYINRNTKDYSYDINMTQEINVPLPNESNHLLNSLKLEYSYKTNVSIQVNGYLYDYNALSYSLYNNSVFSSFTDNTYNISILYKLHSRNGKITIKLYTQYHSNHLLSIEKLKIIANYIDILENYNGYHYLQYDFGKNKTSDNQYRGYNEYQFRIYQDYLKWNYIEFNQYDYDVYSDYSYIYYENITDIEITTHCRYGYNTLDVMITNIRIDIVVNYNITYNIYLQANYDINTDLKYYAKLKYETYNNNRLNLTGIYGNYSYNCFNGFRLLRSGTSQNFHRFFDIPYFNDAITLSRPTITLTESSGSMSEPKYPSSEYWSYETFKITDDTLYSYNYENWSIDYQLIKAEKYNAKYFYKSKTLDKDDLGKDSIWLTKIKFSETFSYTIDLRFVRNALTYILNAIFLFFQYLMFLVMSSISYIFMYIGISIVVFIWNYVIIYLFFAFVIILWYVFSGIIFALNYLFTLLIDTLDYLFNWLWLLLVDFYLYVIIPFFDWFLNSGLPYIVEFILIPIVAFILTLIIWILTLGSIDFADLYNLIHDNLLIISDIFIQLIQEIINNIVGIIAFISLYIIMLLLCLLRHIIVKARGFSNRATSLQNSYEAYLYPIQKFYEIAIKIKSLLAQWF